jgi:hypothetical protein
METLSPLLLRIEKINWLIDRVVYRLYGLSEAEVASSRRAFRDPLRFCRGWRSWVGIFLWPLRGQRRPARSRRAVGGQESS